MIIAVAIMTGCCADKEGVPHCVIEGKSNRAEHGIGQDAMRKDHYAEFGEAGDDRQTLDIIAETYPNLCKLRISSRDHTTHEVDFARIQKMSKLICVDVVARCRLKNLEEFCRARRRKNMSVHVSFRGSHGNKSSRMPEISDFSLGDCFSGSYECCEYGINEIQGVFVGGDSFRFANFYNDEGTNIVRIKKFPSCCNAVQLSGRIELQPSCMGESVEYLVLSCDPAGLQALIKDITPARFPRLRYFRLFAKSRHVCEIDMSGLSHLRSVEEFEVYLRNIIPTGNKDLCNRAERCAVRLGVDLRADGSDGNLIERTPMTPIPPGYKPLPGTIIWDVDEFPIWYEDYELVHRDQQLGGERVGPD